MMHLINIDWITGKLVRKLRTEASKISAYDTASEIKMLKVNPRYANGSATLTRKRISANLSPKPKAQ